MRIFTFLGLILMLTMIQPATAQIPYDDPNLDQVPYYLREKVQNNTDATLSSVVTVNNWDNFSLAVDFAENNMATHPSQPTWFFTAYNTNAAHRTEDGWSWLNSTPNFGTSMAGDPVVAYDSIGNLFYENMYGNISGCKMLVSTNNGATWGPSVTAISGNDKNWLACDQTSGPYANYAYTVMTRSGGGNFARSIDHGLTWTNTFAPTTQNLPGMMVAVGPQGNTQGGAVFVVTNSGNSFASTYTFYVSHDGGASFTLKSTQQWANTVGSQVSGRNSVQNMRTRPYPMIAADNSYGPNRGKFYCVYASNNPPGPTGYPDIFCRSSSDYGVTWSAAVRVNDDPTTVNSHQWHPAIWCDKETGKLYVMWMDTRDTPTNDSALIYATYSADGGNTFVANQAISNKKMKIDCSTCGGGGAPARYQGDYNGIVSNKKVSMLGWTDFRSGTFLSMTGYFPDFAMAIDKASDTLYTPADNITINVSVPAVKLYTDTVLISATIAPVPTAGTITFNFPQGNSITAYPGSKPVNVVLTGSVPIGNYMLTITAAGPNGTPVHKRTVSLKVLEGNAFNATATASPNVICAGLMSQLNVTTLGGTPPFTYQWTPAESLNDPTIANPFASPTETTQYHVIVTDNTSRTAESDVLVTVNHPPAAPGPIIGPQTVCVGDTVTYSVAEVPGADEYSWSVPDTNGLLSGQNTPMITYVWNETAGNIIVVPSNICGPSVEGVLEITLSDIPPAPASITGPDAVCTGSVAKFYTGMNDNGTSLVWSVPPDASITSGQGTDTIYVQWGMTAGDVEVFAYNDCGDGPAVTKMVEIKTAPGPAGSVAGKDTVCQGQGNYLYSIDEITGATSYVWTLPEGATITAGSGTREVTLSFGATAQSGDLGVKGINDCGESIGTPKTIHVKNCTGIEKNTLGSAVTIFPNPVMNELTIRINGNEQNLLMTFTDLSGKVVFSEELKNVPAAFSKQVNMTGFAKGTYLLRLSNGSRSYQERIIVQ